MNNRILSHELSRRDQLESWLAAFMFFSWSVMRIVFCEPEDRWTIPQITPAIIHVVVGILFLLRTQTKLRADSATLIWCLPSFVAGGMAMKFAPDSHAWPGLSQFLFAIGGLGAVIGMLFLGRSFAVFPALRNVVTNGPFRLIRHPIYFCELIMIFGVCSTTGSLLHWSLLLLAAITIVIRIIWEEKILRNSAGYLNFCESVRWRLIPRVW